MLPFPFPCPSIPFDPRYHPHDPSSLQHGHNIRLPPQVPTRLGFPSPSPELSYQAHLGPPAQAPLHPPSASYSMRKLHQVSSLSTVPAITTLPAFEPRPPAYDSLHSNSSACCNETEVWGDPSDSIHWNSPPTSSGLPVTPPNHIFAPQLPYSSQTQPPNSPRHHYVPMPMLSPAFVAPAFPIGNAVRRADTQTPPESKTNLNEGTKDVFQSLKRKRLPVAASFSRPKPRSLPVKKMLPKIHGCSTCGKMFDRPSTLLVVSMMPHLPFIGLVLMQDFAMFKAPGQSHQG